MPGSLKNIEDAMRRRRRDMTFLKDLRNEGRITPAQKAEDQMLMQRNQRDMDNMTRTRNADKKEKAQLMAMANKPKNIMGQKHSLAYMTDQEMEAMNQLKSEPGLRGRLARKGARKKMNIVDGVPAFYDASTDEDQSTATETQPDQGAFETRPEVIANRPTSGGGGDSGGNPSAFGLTPEQIEAKRRADAKKAWDAKNAADDAKFKEAQSVRDRERFTQGRMVDAQGRTAADRGTWTDSEGRVQGDEGFDFETAKRQGGFDESTAKLDTEGSFEGYRQDYKGLRDRADFSSFRDKFAGYGAESDRLRGEAAGKYGGYESKINQMADYGGKVGQLGDQIGGARAGYAGLGSELQGMQGQVGSQVGRTQGQMDQFSGDVASARGDVKSIQDQMGGLAAQAQDPNALMRNRGLFAGQMEAQRKGAEEGNLANIRRSMAASGASPQEIARAESEARKGGAQAGREDALKASQMALQSGQGMLGQAGGFMGNQANLASQRAAMTGQQAGMAMQGGQMGLQGIGQQAGMVGQRGNMIGANIGAMGSQAGMYGNAQNLGLGQIQAGANMYGAGLGAQQNMMGFGAGMAGQGQSSLGSELGLKGGFTGQMAGMTEAQLQDVVAQQNQAFEKEMAEKGYAMQRDAARYGRPQGPSTMDQFTSLVGAVAPVVSMFSDKNLKKNIRPAKDKDLLEPGQIDGFLDSLFAKQYNYKSKKHGEGKQVGIMAQDLENTQLGKQMVENTPEGKRVNFGKGLGLVMASQARLNERLNSIGA